MNNARTFGPIGSLYLALFFAYLFGPLAVMVITAFNSSSFPRISPWDCLTADWFSKLLADEKLLAGLGNSFVIGIGVVIVAIPIGLAAAIVLSQVGNQLRSVIYAIFIAPILMPGVVIGLSTLIFWDRLGTAIGAGYNSLFYDGMFLTVVGQVTFISAYSMLVFLSRLQRFDPTLTEAALDMGATPTQAFTKILLPFMMPAIASSGVLAFLASMENYNTTVFTIVADSTFTTVLAQKVRYGLDPSISAVSVIIVGITLAAAIVFESYKRREDRKARASALSLPMDRPFIRVVSHPGTVAAIVLALIAGAIAWAGTYDSSVCERRILDEKRALQEQLMEEQRQSAPADETAPSTGEPTVTPGKPGNSIFSPGNLTGGETPAKPASPGGVFAPGNLKGGEAPAKPASPFGGVFAPDNLKGGN
ncbi:Inner membrane ABC transporter permease protein YdcV [Hartmannibacter diazotrophicus]|uniref:Inner membrane ABC transporter permease protein YdcV n=1 Tax=Hartmannibacter diazotrophicus TaxID=1482074 RepID=A0A2C9D9B8_9HYPH|nr:ABC transporter permease [Hartmannibacter diazotrophicus]SON56823.1 Inner membrane ABC transporter permease protein YdcV [Hartmannibacter diazotrophicus]